jgi:hypothetical protein
VALVSYFGVAAVPCSVRLPLTNLACWCWSSPGCFSIRGCGFILSKARPTASFSILAPFYVSKVQYGTAGVELSREIHFFSLHSLCS